MATPAVGFESKAIDISKMMTGARLLSTTFSMGIGNLRQIKVSANTTADPTQIRNQKKLIDCPELDEIRSQDAKLRRYIEHHACRYTGQEGVVIIADAMIPTVDRVIVAYETIRRPALVAKFMAIYRAEYASDFSSLRSVLGDVFNKRDYEHPDVVENGFQFNYSYMDIRTDGTISIADPTIRAREEAKAAKIIMQAAEDMRTMMRAAGAKMVEALFDVLKTENGKRKSFQSCHVEHLQEYLETYSVRDVTDDAEYAKHIDTLKAIMGGVSVDKLKHSETAKIALAAKLAEVKQELKAMVIVSGRKFRN